MDKKRKITGRTQQPGNRHANSKPIRVNRALATGAVHPELVSIPVLNPSGPNPFPASGPLHGWFKQHFENEDVKRNRRMSVAFHEAGHLFAAYYFGFALKSRAAELISEGPRLGLTHLSGEDLDFDGSTRSRCRAEEAVLILLAGAAAVRKLRRNYEAGTHLNASDYDQAKRIVEAITPPCNDEDLPWHDGSIWIKGAEGHCCLALLELRSERLISQGWKAIEQLASELMRSNKITAAAVRRIVELQRGCCLNPAGSLSADTHSISASRC